MRAQDFLHSVLKETPPSPRPLLYLDSGDTDGDADDIEPDTIAVRDRLSGLGWTLGTDLYYFLDRGGCHSEAYWGARLALPLRALYGVPSSAGAARRSS